jgi:6-phosphofructokinase
MMHILCFIRGNVSNTFPPTNTDLLENARQLDLTMGNLVLQVQDLCLIPEVPFYMDGPGGLLEFAKQRLRENGHMVIVVAEGAGQELMAESMGSLDKLSDASGNRLLLDVGLWLCQHLKVCIFSRALQSLYK